MKMFLSLAIVLTAASTSLAQSADYNPELIYEALDIAPTNLNPGIVGSSRLQKSVGGLSCVRSLIIVPSAKPTFECVLETVNENHQAIFEALNVEEVAKYPLLVGSTNTMKYVGGLTCTKSKIVAPRAPVEYQCELQQ